MKALSFYFFYSLFLALLSNMYCTSTGYQYIERMEDLLYE